MTEYLSKINLLSQEQYDGSSQKEGELYLVPDIDEKINTVEALQNKYSLNLASARSFRIVVTDNVYKTVEYTYLPRNEESFNFNVVIDCVVSQTIFFSKTIWTDGLLPVFEKGNLYVIEVKSFDGGNTFYARIINKYDNVIAKDNFDRANGALSGKLLSGQLWQHVSGTWEIADNKLKASGADATKLMITDVGFSEAIEVSTDVYVGGSIDAGLVVQFQDSSNYLQVGIDAGLSVRLQQLVNGVVESNSVALLPSGHLVLGTTVKLAVILKPNLIEVYVNGDKVGEKTYFKKATDTKVGFKHYAGATVTFDNLIVKKL